MSQLRRDIAALLEIQKKERRIVELEREIGLLPASLAGLREEVRELESMAEGIKAEIKNLQLKKKEMEIESDSKREEIARYEKQQFEVKTNVEYQAIQKEIADRKVANSRIEDKILDLMEKIEEAEKRARETSERLKTELGEIEKEEKRVEGERAVLSRSIAAFMEERDKLLPGVSEQVLRKYQRIFHNKRDSAVVPLVNYTCGGCHMQLPPQIANNVRKMDGLVICENCSRILYWSEGIEKKEEDLEPVPSETAGK